MPFSVYTGELVSYIDELVNELDTQPIAAAYAQRAIWAEDVTEIRRQGHTKDVGGGVPFVESTCTKTDEECAATGVVGPMPLSTLIRVHCAFAALPLSDVLLLLFHS